jgi:hypothetical protein
MNCRPPRRGFVATVRKAPKKLPHHSLNNSATMSFRKSTRSVQTQRVRSLATSLSLNSRKTNGPNDPPALQASVRTSFIVDVPLGTGSAPFLLTSAKIYEAIPGNAASGNWSHLRVQKVSMWDRSGSPIDFVFQDDGMKFSDAGVPGSRASALHLQPTLFTRSRWYTPVTSANQYGIMHSTSFNNCVMHVTIEVLR